MEISTAVGFNGTPNLVKQEAVTQPMSISLGETDAMKTLGDFKGGDEYFDPILGAVIAAVVLVLLCLAVVVIRYMYRHKGTYHTNEAKGTEFAETADVALRSDPALQDAMDEGKKEYFI
ncbi:hypothetical protein UPYG_G00315010 [Umbra pygmaea]|uniref:Neurexin/syndecan/glycophorin C domain-containing protein n=1 Tax=Umbra pygmaea TaxID=75934 RepID=A0ABD0W0P8_UMBPY